MQNKNKDMGFITFEEAASQSKRIVCKDCNGTFHMYMPKKTYIFCPFCKENALKRRK